MINVRENVDKKNSISGTKRMVRVEMGLFPVEEEDAGGAERVVAAPMESSALAEAEGEPTDSVLARPFLRASRTNSNSSIAATLSKHTHNSSHKSEVGIPRR